MARLLLILFFFWAAPALAADPWSNTDKATESAYLLLHAADWGQSLDIAKNPQLYKEGNSILGEHPSVKRVNSYFVTTALLHVAAVHVMPEKWRPVFQYFWIGIGASVVGHNYNAGLRMNF